MPNQGLMKAKPRLVTEPWAFLTLSVRQSLTLNSKNGWKRTLTFPLPFPLYALNSEATSPSVQGQSLQSDHQGWFACANLWWWYPQVAKGEMRLKATRWGQAPTQNICSASWLRVLVHSHYVIQHPNAWESAYDLKSSKSIKWLLSVLWKQAIFFQ